MNVDALAAMAKQQTEPVDRKNLIYDSRLQQLIKGDVEPPNEYAAFIVRQVREVMANGRTVAQQIEQAQIFLEERNRDAQKLAGAVEQYLLDLKAWDHAVESPSAGNESAEGEKNA